jgi:hypothetical protein
VIFLIITVSAALAFLVSYFWDEIGMERFFNGNAGSSESRLEEITSLGEEIEWQSDGQGLELTIVNSLTDDWDQYFTESIADWSASPSLSITTSERKGSEDSCMHRSGVMTVCNAEYGKTQWSGLNEYSYYIPEGSDKKYIISSMAIMNDSYLNGKSDAEKLYVMCHEIGHGYGLQHRDIDLGNTNLGTCMDYTSNFVNTSKPDAVDFQALFEIYGNLGTGRNLRENSALRVRRQLEGNMLERMEGNDFRVGRMLYRSKLREHYETDLGDGSFVVTSLLLVTEDEYVEP